MWIFSWKGPSGFSASSTAEKVTQGINGTGLTAIITGASSGLGEETTRVLALRGVHVVMAVRNVDAGRKVRETILKNNHSAKIDVELDLGSMTVARKFAADYNSSGRPLNLLVRHVNVKRKDGLLYYHRAHIYVPHEGIRFDKINDESGYSSVSAYGQSKLANILHANELARRLKEGEEITVNSLHPGAIITNIFRHHVIAKGSCNIFFKMFNRELQLNVTWRCIHKLRG
ncbi:Short-chain dehydrogenase TIC 32, chloroplastic [Quillaja saponaria]|uniref:Short-chain dehydrogenase TIC 32, chloroplastic n=1 Tax=Quillaja saponaria TaxID=32244 RepID=A0AAD7PEL2_QUISA|nr:Short-chain dehydrogenase TIC 32, chloroplastic [Quillaja saponaria]